MPLLKLSVSKKLSNEETSEILSKLSKMLAETIGKPEQYVMITIANEDFIMSGTTDDAAFLDIRSIGGLNGEVCCKLSENLCMLLEDKLSIPKQRIYINFTEILPSHWGFNGATFG